MRLVEFYSLDEAAGDVVNVSLDYLSSRSSRIYDVAVQELLIQAAEKLKKHAETQTAPTSGSDEFYLPPQSYEDYALMSRGNLARFMDDPRPVPNGSQLSLQNVHNVGVSIAHVIRSTREKLPWVKIHRDEVVSRNSRDTMQPVEGADPLIRMSEDGFWIVLLGKEAGRVDGVWSRSAAVADPASPEMVKVAADMIGEMSPKMTMSARQRPLSKNLQKMLPALKKKLTGDFTYKQLKDALWTEYRKIRPGGSMMPNTRDLVAHAAELVKPGASQNQFHDKAVWRWKG